MDFIAELTRANFDTHFISRLSAYIFQVQNDAQTLRIKDKELALKNAEIHCKNTKIAALTLELAYYKRLRFANKSESFTSEQGELFKETLQTDIEAMHAEVEQLAPPTARAKRVRTGRQPLPENLERVEHRHEPESCECQQCGALLVKVAT
jgi:transposase